MNDIANSEKTDSAFDRAGFLRALQTLPHDMIFEMARDGKICEMEIARIFERMKLPPSQIQALRPHLNAIARLVLDYAQKDLGLQVDLQLCQLTCAQSIIIMEGLLKKGLIQPYFELANAGIKAPPAIGLQQATGHGISPVA